MFQQFFRSMTIFRLSFLFLMDYWQLRWIRRSKRGERQQVAIERLYARSGVRFRRAALRLQGLIVKVGQFLSARTDVLPLSFTRELAQLQDAVPPAPFVSIRLAVESELGASMSTLFSQFEETAVAAASFGQVHRATLKDGQVVAVKIMRPGIDRLARTDLAALRKVVGFLYRFTRFGKQMNILEIYREFARIARQELDYRIEAEHLKRFQKQFASDSRIHVPRVYDTYISRRILMMEYLDGAKVTDVSTFESWGVSRDKVIDVLLDVFLQQIIVYGFVHVDPHPGNLLVLPDGRIGILDFGMMSEIPSHEMAIIVRLVRATVIRDFEAVVRAIDELGFLQPHADRAFLKRALAYMYDRISGIELRKGRELEDFMTEFQNFLHDEPLIVQAKYMFLGRAIGLLSGLVSTLSPSFPWTKFLQERALPLVGKFGASSNAETVAWRKKLMDAIAAVLGDTSANSVDFAIQQAQEIMLTLMRMPTQVDHLLQKADRGELTIRFELDDVLSRLDRQERLMVRGFWLICTAGTAIATVWLHSRGYHMYTDVGIGLTGACLCLFIRNLVWGGKPRRRRVAR